MSLILSRRDLDFLLFEWLDVESLLERKRYAEHSRETFTGALDLAEEVATDHFAPHNRTADLHEPTYDGRTVHLTPEVQPALRAFVDAGFLSMPLDAAEGGDQLPFSVYCACMGWFHAANAGTTGYPLLTMGAAHLIRAHGSAEQIERFAVPMTEGRFLGTMALSEPQAGSNLADLTTRAEPQADGTYRLFGRKMWISGGDNDLTENIVHMVLARTPGRPGRHPRNLAVHRAQAPGQRRRLPRRAQRHHAGRDQPQDGLPGHGQHRPRVRRRRVHAGRPGRRRRVPGGCREPRPAADVRDDERGSREHRALRGGLGLHRVPEVAAVRPGAAAGASGRGQPDAAAGGPRRASRRTADAAGAEVLRGGCAGAGALRRAGVRRGPLRGGRSRPGARPTSC